MKSLNFIIPEEPTVRDHRYNKFVSIGQYESLPSFGIEVELCTDSEEAYGLIKYGFVPTLETDSDVKIEFKSPIIRNRVILKEIYPILEHLRDKIVSTHIHVNVKGVRGQLRDNWDYYWFDILDWMNHNTTKTSQIFGRVFNDWARCEADPESRFSTFNIRTLYPTYEIRLAKFTSTYQFDRLISWSRSVGQVLLMLRSQNRDLVKTKLDDEFRKLVNKV